MSKCIAITGGSGYIGQRLAERILHDHQSIIVVLLDISFPTIDLIPERLIFRHCDLRSIESVEQSLVNVNYVYHLASFGMSGKDMLNHSMIEQVNVIGTKNLIEICRKFSIEKLIYCSTYNAVFTGRVPLENVTEDQCSYPTSDLFFDHYSRTKSQAEQMILQANSSLLKTVAIRPAAIYGDGELRHLPRIFDLARRGLTFFAIGNEQIRCDWLFVDNLINALILAEKSLPEHSGEAYFISDDHPVNNFHFLSQLTDALGYKNSFRFYLPTTLMFFLGFCFEMIYLHLFPLTPFLSRSEVLKVGVTHFANINKAKTKLGYRVEISPEKAIERCIRWYSEHGYRQIPTSSSNISILILIFILFVLLILFIIIG